MNLCKVNINEYEKEKEYSLDEIKSFVTFEKEDLNKDIYKKSMKTIEKDLNLNNLTFKGFIYDGKWKKDTLQDICDRYEKIKRNLIKINIFLDGEENKNTNE